MLDSHKELYRPHHSCYFCKTDTFAMFLNTPVTFFAVKILHMTSCVILLTLTPVFLPANSNLLGAFCICAFAVEKQRQIKPTLRMLLTQYPVPMPSFQLCRVKVVRLRISAFYSGLLSTRSHILHRQSGMGMQRIDVGYH